MTLAFLQAFNAKQSGAISWDEYIHILLARCVGIKHEEDNVRGTYPKLRRIDPFGHNIWMMSNHMGTIQDIGPIEAVFKAYRHETFDDVKNKLASLEGVPIAGIRGVKKSLALLACQDRRVDVLKFCLDEGGFPIEATFEDEAASVDVANDPETFSTLEQSRQFQRIRAVDELNRKSREEREREQNGQDKHGTKDENGNVVRTRCGARPGAAAVFDRGGKLPVDW